MEDNAHDWPGSRVRLLASPLVRRIAAERGLDLSAVTGSGPGGRIVERDLGADLGLRAASVGDPPTAKHDGEVASEGQPQDVSVGDDSVDLAPEDRRKAVPSAGVRVRGEEVIALRLRVPADRLCMLQDVIGERYGPVPLWAFVARAVLRLGHRSLAVAEGFGAPRILDAAPGDPITAIASRIGDRKGAACVLVDLAGESLSGGDLPLPDEADIQIVLGAPCSGACVREVEISLVARPDIHTPAEAAALLKSVADALERPGALLASLPEL